MKAEVLEKLKAAAQELISAPSCSAEARAAGEKWLQAVGTPDEEAATAALMQEMEADVTSVEGLIALAESELGKKIFGEAAPGVAAHGREIKAAGAKYCDCPACVAAVKILSLKDEL